MSAIFQALHNQLWLVILDLVYVYPSLEEAIKKGGKDLWGENPLEFFLKKNEWRQS